MAVMITVSKLGKSPISAKSDKKQKYKDNTNRIERACGFSTAANVVIAWNV